MDTSGSKTYSNIETTMKHQINITPAMLINKDHVGVKNTKEGQQDIFKYSFNDKFWLKIMKSKKRINVVIDEAHTIFNSRRSMSKTNQIMTTWLALIRRVLGTSDQHGSLTLITQLHHRLDLIARDMATQIRFHVCHYQKVCSDCGCTWSETSEEPEPTFRCLHCASWNVHKKNHIIEAYHFKNMKDYEWQQAFGEPMYYKHYLIHDIEKVFPLYNTLQWQNMFEDMY